MNRNPPSYAPINVIIKTTVPFEKESRICGDNVHHCEPLVNWIIYFMQSWLLKKYCSVSNILRIYLAYNPLVAIINLDSVTGKAVDFFKGNGVTTVRAIPCRCPKSRLINVDVITVLGKLDPKRNDLRMCSRMQLKWPWHQYHIETCKLHRR